MIFHHAKGGAMGAKKPLYCICSHLCGFLAFRVRYKNTSLAARVARLVSRKKKEMQLLGYLSPMLLVRLHWGKIESNHNGFTVTL